MRSLRTFLRPRLPLMIRDAIVLTHTIHNTDVTYNANIIDNHHGEVYSRLTRSRTFLEDFKSVLFFIPFVLFILLYAMSILSLCVLRFYLTTIDLTSP